MLTDLDAELFPDDCEVVAMPLRNLYVYLIQKNASSSMRELARRHGFEILRNSDLTDLDAIDLYIRQPESRYISGVNMFVKRLLRDRPDLDYHTAIWFATRYRFLNRHYLPQWHWLLNLARYLHADCRLRFHHMEDLETLTDLRLRPGVTDADQQLIESCQKDSSLSFWFYTDQILRDLNGQDLTWDQLIQLYQDKGIYSQLTRSFAQLKHVLP